MASRKKQVKESASYKVVEDFELFGVAYKKGDLFEVPANLKRDLNMEEFRNLDRPRPTAPALAFSFEYDSGVRENKVPVMLSRTVVLPLEEA